MNLRIVEENCNLFHISSSSGSSRKFREVGEKAEKVREGRERKRKVERGGERWRKVEKGREGGES